MTFTAVLASNTVDTRSTGPADFTDEDRMPPTYGDQTMATSDMYPEPGNSPADASRRFDRDPTQSFEEPSS